MREPRPYQIDGNEFVMRRLYDEDQKGAGLLWDPGLGKTGCALHAVQMMFELGAIQRALVIAPKRVCQMTWPEEIREWDVPLRYNVLCGRVRTALRETYAPIEIINGESLHLLQDQGGRWDLVVVDESYKFKSWSGSYSKRKGKGPRPRRSRMPNLRKMLPHIKKRIIMTGDPAAYSLGDLFSQIFILDDGEALGKNVTVFRARFMEQGGYQGREWRFRPEMEDELLELIAPMVMRLDAASNLDMPELQVNTIKCNLPDSCRREYNRLKRDLLAELETGNVLAQNSASAYMKMRQFANGAVFDENRKVHHVHDEKLEAIADFYEELGRKRPFLLFYQFDHDQQRLRKRFKEVRVLRGGTSDDEAARLINAWNEGDLPFLAIQNQAGSHGLNLQKGPCADVGYMGLTTIADVHSQSVRRVYRQGQKNKIVCEHRFLTAGTVEDTIAERLDGRLKTQADFLDALKKHARSP